MTTPIISKDRNVLSMSAVAAPVARMQPGTSIRLQTADCFGDQVQGPGDVERGIDWDVINPATGPVLIEGAEPGDVLAVRIEQIEVADHGLMCTGDGWGVLGDRISTLSWRFLTIRDREAQWEGGPTYPHMPMIGVIGVAPAGAMCPAARPAITAATLTRGSSRRAPRSTFRWPSRERCWPPATCTPPWATARSLSPVWRSPGRLLFT